MRPPVRQHDAFNFRAPGDRVVPQQGRGTQKQPFVGGGDHLLMGHDRFVFPFGIDNDIIVYINLVDGMNLY